MTNAADGSRTFPIFTRELRAALSRQTEAEFSVLWRNAKKAASRYNGPQWVNASRAALRPGPLTIGSLP